MFRRKKLHLNRYFGEFRGRGGRQEGFRGEGPQQANRRHYSGKY
jgi:hypothetical protein